MRPLQAELMRRSSPLPLIEISSTLRHPVKVEITGQALTWARCWLLVIMHAFVDTITDLQVQLLNIVFLCFKKPVLSNIVLYFTDWCRIIILMDLSVSITCYRHTHTQIYKHPFSHAHTHALSHNMYSHICTLTHTYSLTHMHI